MGARLNYIPEPKPNAATLQLHRFPKAGPLPAPYLEVLKRHLPERGLCLGHKEVAVLTKTADILAVEGVDAGPCDLGSIEVGDGAIAVDFKVLHGKPVPGRHWVEAISQSEPTGGHGGVR